MNHHMHHMDMTTSSMNDSSTMPGMDGHSGMTGMGGMGGMGNMGGMGHGMEGMDGMSGMSGMDMCPMNMNMNGSMGGMMMMYFHTGHCEYVLFKELLVSTAGQMVGACVAIFFLAFFYEGLKVFREYLLRRALAPKYNSEVIVSSKYSQSSDTMVIDPHSAKPNGQSREHLANAMDYRKNDDVTSGSDCTGSNYYPTREIARTHIISTAHFIQTLLHVIQVFISYCLMLAFMTYNVWLCLAVILGAGAGYFMFGWRRAVVVDVNEHCH